MKMMKQLMVGILVMVMMETFSGVVKAAGMPLQPPDGLTAEIAALEAQLQAMRTVAENGGNVNPLNIARAFALKTPDHYQGSLSGEMLTSNQFEWVQLDFTMNKQFAITSLSVNGNPITLLEPIAGLPMGFGGLMRNATLWVNAQTAGGENAGSGSSQWPAVKKGDVLVVALVPAGTRQEIPLPSGVDGNDVNLNIENFPYGFGYGVGSDGKLNVDLPPVGGKYYYTLRLRSTGEVIGSGWLEPFKAVVTPNEAYAGITYLGNVIGAEFGQQDGLEGWTGVQDVIFNCSIPMSDGTTVTGKVVFVDVGSGGLDVNMSGDFSITVQSANADGDMPFLALVDASTTTSGPGWSWTQTRVYTTQMNVGKVVITIIPKPTNTYANPYMNLHRFYGSPNGGGGGLGAPVVVGSSPPMQ